MGGNSREGPNKSGGMMSTNRADFSEAMKDPVCGMSVDPATAKHVHTHAGESYYFCGGYCVEKFKASPDKYLNPGAKAPSAGLTMLAMPSPESSVTDDANTKDPVCGMDVNPGTARYKSEHTGKAYYFCSAHCLEKFRATPNSYLAPRPIAAPSTPLAQITAAPAKAAPQPPVGNYICPMCPEVRETKPGPCPVAAWHLNPRCRHRPPALSTPALCIPRSSGQGRARARSAAWHSSRAR